MHLTRAFNHAGRSTAALALLALSLSALPGAPAVAATTGEQKTAVILVNFQDETSQPISAAAAQSLVFGDVSDFYWEASYQKTFFSGNTFGWFTIPVSKSSCDINLIAQKADQAATASGVNLGAYARLVYMFPQNACSASGYNSGSGSLPSRTWIKGNNFNSYVISHELGHNFGLLHSQGMDCGSNVIGGTCSTQSYGDPADTMGYGATPHFNAFQKELLGWLNTTGQPPITKVSASGTYRIEPYATTGTGAKAIKIPKGIDPATGQMTHYYIEYRQLIGFDASLEVYGGLTNGVLVHTGVDGDGFSSFLLDMTPGSVPTSTSSDMEDAALAVGRTFVDSVAGVTFKLASADATGATLDVTIAGSNPAPVCTRAAPTLSLGGPTTAVAAGSTASYTLSVSNKDSGACAATTFNLARSLPAGWAGTLAASSLSLSAGTNGSTTLTVTSPASASAGGYGIGAGASSSIGSTHTANASTTYTIASAPGTGTLSETVGTDKTSYVRGQTVNMSALVKLNGVAVNGASVKFNVNLPGGGVTVLTATSGSDGYARSNYKIGKAKGAIGNYAVRADATSGSNTTTASTSFSAQ
jgi:hypothetical protein